MGILTFKKLDNNVVLRTPKIPKPKSKTTPRGTKDILTERGRDGLIKWVKDQDRILYTDTTFRDAHQSLLATRMRTYDLAAVAESFSKNHGQNLFSMEVWGAPPLMFV